MNVSGWARAAGLGCLAMALGACGAPASSPAATGAPASSAAVSGAAKPAPPAAGASGSTPASASANASGAASGAVFSITSTNQSPSNLFMYYALDKGIFARNGVRVEMPTMSGQAQMETVIAGHADSTLKTGVDLVFNSEAATHLGLRIVATGSTVSDSYILTRKDITSLSQLRGKKFAMQSTTTGASQQVIRLLKNEGLEANKDYQIVLTGNQGQIAGVVASIQAGVADAAAAPPAAARAALQGGQIHVLQDMATRTDLPYGSNAFAMTQATIDKRGGDVQKIVDGWMQAEEAIAKDKAGAQELIKKYYKIDDQAALDEEYQRHLETTAKIPMPAKEQYVDIVAAMPKDHPLSDAEFSAMIEPRFVQDAVNRGLGKW